jgi:hypothetical protein
MLPPPPSPAAATQAYALTVDDDDTIESIVKSPRLKELGMPGRSLHSPTSELNLRTFGTHRERYSST